MEKKLENSMDTRTICWFIRMKGHEDRPQCSSCNAEKPYGTPCLQNSCLFCSRALCELAIHK